MMIRVLTAGVLVTLLSVGRCARQEAHITLSVVPQRFEVKIGPNRGDAIAWGSFDNRITDTGFGYLEIYTSQVFPSQYQAYAAGILEGYLTRTLISMHYNNTMRDYCKGQTYYCIKLYVFLQKNLDYINRNIKQYREKEPYWFQTELALIQLSGIQDAWSAVEGERYSPHFDGYTHITPLLFLNVDGDLEDLEQALRSPKLRRVHGGGHCSALVKMLSDNSDLLVSHVTWNDYSGMLRILKKYSLNYTQVFFGGVSDGQIPGSTMTFSSSPGRIFSGDDYHLISSGLVSMETTIGNSNPALWSKITPKCNLEWLRTIVANRLATTGDEWSRYFQRERSGSYNNQWMIVDYKKFAPGQPIQPGTLTVLEEIPGMVKFADQSSVLNNQGYWPSYNIPFYKEIYDASGWEESVKRFGDWFTYDRHPRANIFRRDHVKVKDIDSMMKLMRYNDFYHDEFSKCNCSPPYSAENAISARNDLNLPNGTYPFMALAHRSHGGTDAKVTNINLFKNLEFLSVCGPTYDPLPPFQWSKSGLNNLHEGQPDLWTFKPHVHHWSK
ncbi:putative phospholipase B-like 2 isoform X1 [Varroa jacobsoni]|uniref:putative phospholipase B-like 2 isoform X1 n=1 Tax=Varroa jacobsoni TaxID=62625 RepID=UPI000BF34BEB|nr:putative phospholipase B-like 2 isoform X1 [Varroa jacobsoni]XP_022694154.1 putative phospholipase B-like 2 isoform X1 [Varroa jacobsoni]XP_022694156.1 putative phospholipase B-like 2 isoform X1 [Varroa jacobsoni]